MSQEHDVLKEQLSNLDFAYALVLEDYDKVTTLEVTVSLKVCNAVVEGKWVGKQLLISERPKERVMVIPLNKISPFLMSTMVCPAFVVVKAK